jgi:hypothetical protein
MMCALVIVLAVLLLNAVVFSKAEAGCGSECDLCLWTWDQAISAVEKIKTGDPSMEPPADADAHDVHQVGGSMRLARRYTQTRQVIAVDRGRR